MTNITFLQHLLLLSITFLSFFRHSFSTSILVANKSITDNQTLVSENKRFEFGFFSLSSPNNTYLGIWYKDISPLAVVWIANRNTTLTGSSGVLKLDDRSLLLLKQGESVVWSSNQSTAVNTVAEKPVAKLLDTGNLVVTEESDDSDDQESYIWQSFDHAVDTLLPSMKLGWNNETGIRNTLVSWKGSQDPSAGDFSFVLEPHMIPEVYLLQNQTWIYRSGPWNGVQFSGVPEMKSDDGMTYTFFTSENKTYYSFGVNESVLTRVVVDYSGNLQRLVWLGGGNGWTSYWDVPTDRCDNYKECGAYGICNTNDSPVCFCVNGFEPKNKVEWDLRDGSSGCVQKTIFECGKNDSFMKFEGMKLPDCSRTYHNHSMNIKECKEICKRNCSCTAYANSDIQNGGSGCIIWIGELVDLRQYANGGQDLYVRVAASEIGSHHKSKLIIITVATISVALLLLGLTVCFIWKRKRMRERNENERDNKMKSQELALISMFSLSEEHKNDDVELPSFDFDIIAATTQNFSDVNKLGQGGFGSVYKGTLADGQQIAVKRLSKNSGQGVEEFRNEVTLIAKLQHRNLVRLLGCSIACEEKMLIYEYMPNKSLDSFLFDKSKKCILDWAKRFSIIMGIARGLLYLHQDSRFRIIHRDLKASNILLDNNMNPKIADFGMARIFGGDQTEASTRRVVGTYGYMSPEYAMDGLFSVKSDVFSYGVLVLEIVSGKKNRGFYSSSDELNLLGHAWKLWEEGKDLELMDESLSDTCSIYEVLKCIHVGLLCVQEHAEDRPTISSVVLMMGSENACLAEPKQPGFSLRKASTATNSSSIDQETFSRNQVTITMQEAR